MKKIKIKLLLLIGVIISMVGCDTSLNEKVFSSITEQNYNYSEADFGPNIAGAYIALRYNYVGSYWQSQELSGCCIVTPANSTGWDDGGIYKRFHFHNWNSELGQIRDLWNNYYAGVVLCNSAINRVENDIIKAPSEQLKEEGLAELKVLRAYYYWVLMDNFGDIPLVTTLSQEFPEKASRTKVYDFLIDELTESIPKLNEEQGGKMYGRMNKWAGRTLLANIYLNAEVYTGTPRWDECLKECDEIIKSKKCALSPNFRDSFRASGVESSKEVLFTIPYDYARGIVGNFLFMNSWHSELQKKFQTNAVPNMAGGPKGITQFINTYQADDSRLDDTWLHGQQFDAEGNLLYGVYDKKGEPLVFSKELPDGKYTNEMEGYRFNKMEVSPGSEWSCNTDIPLFRYSEVLMMKAECLLRLGKSGAGQLVTEVRERAFKNNPKKAMVTDEELKANSAYQWGYVENYQITEKGDQTPVNLGRLFDERCWEFVWEGHTRRDMIRFSLYTTKSWLSHKPIGDNIVFPIPQEALNSNPKLIQNPNYLSQ